MRLRQEEEAGEGEGMGMDVIIVITEYKHQLKSLGYAPKTIDGYGYGLKCFASWLQDNGITDFKRITRQAILDYQADVMSEPKAAETKAIKIRAVKRLFEYLEDTHRLLINPAEGMVETCRKNRKIGRVLTVQEMNKLLEQPNLSLNSQIRDRAIMEVLYTTGIRSDEMLNLHVYDADFKDKILYIRKGKGKKQRVAPLGKSAIKYLSEYLEKIRPKHAKRNPKERKLFLTVEGLPLTWNCMRTKIDMYRKQAGIKEPVGLHAFRRSCATHMLQQGADIRYIQKLLGHKYLRTTQQYTKVIPVDVKKTHEKTHPNANGNTDKKENEN